MLHSSPILKSYFDCDKGVGRFHGVLDIKTLGGAGFASQRTTGENRAWDLSGYAGISLDVAAADCESSYHTCMQVTPSTVPAEVLNICMD